jgi:hypothetical protein
MKPSEQAQTAATIDAAQVLLQQHFGSSLAETVVEARDGKEVLPRGAAAAC